MSERETKQIAIEEHTFEVKTYATAREVKAMQQPYFQGSKVNIVGDTPQFTSFDASVQEEVEKAVIEAMVVSLDGSSDDLFNRCMDLPSDTYFALVEQLDELVSKKKS